MLNSLSGRFLILTTIFVMLAEVLIFVPSIARFRHDYLLDRLARAQIAAFALLATPDHMVDPALERELLRNAEVDAIILRRDAVRELVLVNEEAAMVRARFDLRQRDIAQMIREALRALVTDAPRQIRIIGMPVKEGGLEIEATLPEAPLQQALRAYARNIFLLSLVISAITAALLFIAVRRFVVRPIERVAANIAAFREDPADGRRVMVPGARLRELRDAEDALAQMQAQIASALRQKDRLAQLGGALARVSHDLRNLLATATLLADRLDSSTDPAVARVTPKLIGALERANALCARTLEFGRADEPPPEPVRLALAPLLHDIIAAEQAHASGAPVAFGVDLPEELMVFADPEQLHRALLNLTRNARQALQSAGKGGEIRLSARHTASGTEIDVQDNGPGLSDTARAALFRPFEGSARRGGTGLGLTIAHERIKAHGGALRLVESTPGRTIFRISLPD